MMKVMFEVETKEVYIKRYYAEDFLYTGCYEKEYRKRYKVHNVRDDGNGYPQFLIFEDGQWRYKSAKYFVPVEENNNEEDQVIRYCN